jgi:uncharacterized protein YkwD
VRAARTLAGVAAAVALLVPAASAAPQPARAALSPLESGVLVQINTFRRAHRLAPLAISLRLNAAARAHSTQMAQGGFFAHESADGSLFWKRIRAFYASSP